MNLSSSSPRRLSRAAGSLALALVAGVLAWTGAAAPAEAAAPPSCLKRTNNTY